MRFEQAVYGSFPFWNRGYGILAQSPGCHPRWLAELRTVCQRFGEPPAGTPHVEAVFAMRLECGPWVVAGVNSQGCDDRGRPGALAFHALFLGRFGYPWVGCDPFAMKNELRQDWLAGDQDRALPSGRLSFWPRRLSGTATEENPLVGEIATAIMQKRRVVVQSSAPIDALVRDVWARIPFGARLRASVATWAFDTSNGFDLVALPKLTGLVLEPSDLILALEPAGR